MTGTRVAALVMIPLAIVVGVVSGRLWHVSHSPQIAVLADHPATSAPDQAATVKPTPATPIPAQATPAVAALPKLETTKPSTPVSDGKIPSFDVVRVEPKGDAVVAGKGAPNAKVALLSGGKVVGEAKSDGNGQFVILPERLAPGDHALTLRQTPDGAPARESAQSVAISVPKPDQDKSKVVVALAEPGKPTKLLSPPPGANTGAPTPAGPIDKVIVRSTELENGTGLYVSGAATPGTSVRVYLNDSHIADVVAGADGAWSVRVKHGLTGGHYSVRADAAGSGGKVASRAEVPFDVPDVMADAGKSPVAPPTGAVASAPPPAATSQNAEAQPHGTPTPAAAATPNTVPQGATSPTAPSPVTAASDVPKSASADAVIETVATARVTTGDNLWNISRFRLGDGTRYTQIYAANSDQIRDPNLIYPGQVFVVPSR